jgi:hypothetical protein
MEALSTFFAFGSLWFFILTAFWVVILFIWVEKEYIIWSGIITILYILFLNLTVNNSILDTIVSHPVRALIIIIEYFLLGFIWFFVKWWLFVTKKAIAYKEKRYTWLLSQKEYKKERGISIEGLQELTLETKVPLSMNDDWLRHYGYNRDIPKAIQHKRTISHWVLYWPISALWSLIDDFVGKVIRIIVVRIRALYEAITRNAFKNIEEIK